MANIDDYCFSPLGPAVDVTRRGILPDNEPLLDYVIVMEWAERGSLERVTYQDENELFSECARPCQL